MPNHAHARLIGNEKKGQLSCGCDAMSLHPYCKVPYAQQRVPPIGVGGGSDNEEGRFLLSRWRGTRGVGMHISAWGLHGSLRTKRGFPPLATRVEE